MALSDLDLYANFERASNRNAFYRMCTPVNTEVLEGITTHDWKLRVMDIKVPDLDISSNYDMQIAYGYYNPDKPLSDDEYDPVTGDITFGNPHFETFQSFLPNEDGLFVTKVNWDTTLPCVCAVFVKVTDTLTNQEKTFQLSGIFVEEKLWPRLDFIAWPEFQISPRGNSIVQRTVGDDSNPSSAVASDGVYFYGEGHKELINMRAVSATTFTTTNYIERYKPFTEKLSNAIDLSVDTIKWFIGYEPVTKTTFNNPGIPLLTGSEPSIKYTSLITPVPDGYKNGPTDDDELGQSVTITNYDSSIPSVTIQLTDVQYNAAGSGIEIILDNRVGEDLAPNGIYPAGRNTFKIDDRDPKFRLNSSTLKPYIKEGITLSKDLPFIGAFESDPKILSINAPDNTITLDQGLQKEIMVNPKFTTYQPIVPEFVPVKAITRTKQSIFIYSVRSFAQGATTLTLVNPLDARVKVNDSISHPSLPTSATIKTISTDRKSITIPAATSKSTAGDQQVTIKSDLGNDNSFLLDSTTSTYNKITPNKSFLKYGDTYYKVKSKTADGTVSIYEKIQDDDFLKVETFAILGTAGNVEIISGANGADVVVLNANNPTFTDANFREGQTVTSTSGIPADTTILRIDRNYLTLSKKLTASFTAPSITVGTKAINVVQTAYSGSTVLFVDKYDQDFNSIASGQSVTGTGIAASTTVSKWDFNTGAITLSKALTADLILNTVQAGKDAEIRVREATLKKGNVLFLDTTSSGWGSIKRDVPISLKLSSTQTVDVGFVKDYTTDGQIVTTIEFDPILSETIQVINDYKTISAPIELPRTRNTLTIAGETCYLDETVTPTATSIKLVKDAKYNAILSKNSVTINNINVSLADNATVTSSRVGYLELYIDEGKNLTIPATGLAITGTGIAEGTQVLSYSSTNGYTTLSRGLTGTLSTTVKIADTSYNVAKPNTSGQFRIALNPLDPDANTIAVGQSVSGYGITTGSTIVRIDYITNYVTLNKALTANVGFNLPVTKPGTTIASGVYVVNTDKEGRINLNKPTNIFLEEYDAGTLATNSELNIDTKNINPTQLLYIKEGNLVNGNNYFENCVIDTITKATVTVNGSNLNVLYSCFSGESSIYIDDPGSVIKEGSIITGSGISVNTTITSWNPKSKEAILSNPVNTNIIAFKVKLTKATKLAIGNDFKFKITKSVNPYIREGMRIAKDTTVGNATVYIKEFIEDENKLILTEEFEKTPSAGTAIKIVTDTDYASWFTNKVFVDSSANQQSIIEYPISMWATNKRIKLNGPYVSYDDITGLPEYYPFFASSIRATGNPHLFALKENIKVLPYPEYPNAKIFSSMLSAERIDLPLDFTVTPLSAGIEFRPLQESSFLYEEYKQTSWEVKAFADFGGRTANWSIATGPQPSTLTTLSTPISAYKFNISYQQTPSELSLASWTVSPIVDTTLTVNASAYKNVVFQTWKNKGVYNSTVTYNLNETVIYRGTGTTDVYYRSIQSNNKGHEPGKNEDYWVEQTYGVSVPESYYTSTRTWNDWTVKNIAVPLTIKTTASQIPYTNIYLPSYFNLLNKPTRLSVGVWHPSVDKIKVTSPSATGFFEKNVENPIWNYRGTYDKAVLYKQGDSVTYAYNVYVYISTTPNQLDKTPDTNPTIWTPQKAQADLPFYTGSLVFNKLGVADLVVEATLKDKFTNNVNKTITFTLPAMTEIVENYDEDIDSRFVEKDKASLELTYTEAPKISPNEWVTADNVNSIIYKIYNTIDEINLYTQKPAERTKFYAWWGLMPTPDFIPKLVWKDIECVNNTFDDSIKETTWQTLTSTSSLSSLYTWQYNACTDKYDPACKGKHCLEWKWSSLTQDQAEVPVTWADTRGTVIRNEATVQEPGKYAKRWAFERCDRQVDPRSCNKDSWNVSTIDTEAFPVYYARSIERCNFVSCGAFPDSELIVSVYPTEVVLHYADYEASILDREVEIDGYLPFANLVAASYDEEQRLVAVLDQSIPRVAIYKIKTSSKNYSLEQAETWGLYGTRSTAGFNEPTDIHMDQDGFVWLCDAGNNCFKKFNIKGRLLLTIYINDFAAEENKPKSICIDYNKNVHCLAGSTIFVFDKDGNFLFKYQAPDYISEYRKITTSYNRKAVYLSHIRGVAKFYMNGTFFYNIARDVKCMDDSYIEEFNQMYQDSTRNLYVVCKDKVLKYGDLQKIIEAKANIKVGKFWNIEDLLIDKEEYVQPLVYMKNFQRLWDNIELLRNALFYDETSCKKYTPPVYLKEDIVIGQNELVSNAIINRLSDQLWTNLSSIIEYFNSECEN